MSPDENDDSFIVKLHCPGLTSMKWIVKLYSLVLGGLGVILSFTWICFHLYVLGVTSLAELRQHRSVKSKSDRKGKIFVMEMTNLLLES